MHQVLFLTSVHSSTSFDKLAAGLNTLQQAVNNRAETMRALVQV